MNKIRVFVSSSSNFRHDERLSYFTEKDIPDSKNLKNIIDFVQKKCDEEYGPGVVEITPWWIEPLFKSAGTIKDTVYKISHDYDIGIFVIENDRKDIRKCEIISGKKRKKITGHTPNSNVYLEYGLFMSLGKFCYIIKRDNDTTLPTDISNENSISLSDPKEQIIEGILDTIEKFNRKRKEIEPYIEHNQLYFYKDLSKNYMEYNAPEGKQKLADCGTKALFIGSKSAYLWGKIENNNDYPETIVVRDFVKKYWEQREVKCFGFKDIEFDNVVSLGPGVGTIDRELLAPFRENNRIYYYIPVDINPLLAIASMNHVGGDKAFAIVDDFEDAQFFVRLKRFLKDKGPEIGKNNLFSMLGVTFSNLSSNDSTLFSDLISVMENGNDFFLLDVIISDKTERDGEYMSDDEIEEFINKQIKSLFKDFLDSAVDRLVGESFELSCKVLSNNNRYSDVSGTKVVTITYSNDKANNKANNKDNILLVAKFYKFKEIKESLGEKFKIVTSAKYLENRRGVFLLQKRNVNE